MKLTPPFPLNTITQGFGLNGTPLYKQQGLLGHTGIDFVPPHPLEKPIPSAENAWCYSFMNKDNPDLSKYRAVYTVVDDTDYSYELSYGHCNKMYPKLRTEVKGGETIATVGNTGDVFVGGVAIKDRSTGVGAHLHFQVRKLKKIAKNTVGYKYNLLTDANGVLERDGHYYQVVDPQNGYNGCVDPAQFFGKFFFNKNLWFGQESGDVLELQKRLDVDYSTGPGYFGFRTLKAVLAYQKANGITPTGFFGPISRAKINSQ